MFLRNCINYVHNCEDLSLLDNQHCCYEDIALFKCEEILEDDLLVEIINYV